MAYEKPGVTVKQSQTTVSPTFAPPSLVSCVVGLGYHVVEATEDTAYLYETDELTNPAFYKDEGLTGYLAVPEDAELDVGFVFVDMQNSMGNWKHISDEYFSVNGSTNSVTISGGLVSSVDPNLVGASIRVGYRASRKNIDSYLTVNSSEKIEERVGKITTYNPLAFGLQQALTNARSEVAAYGVKEDSVNEHSKAIENLSLQEVYSLAPLTQKDVFGNYKTHVENMSGEQEKKERIVFLSKPYTWFEADGKTEVPGGPLDEDTDKTGTAVGLAATAFGVGSKRTFYVNPDTCYVQEERPVATVKQEYLSKIHDKLSTYGLYAKFTNNWTYRPGTNYEKKYFAGDNITDEVWERLVDNEHGYYSKGRKITVDVPVPGYYLAAILAGMVSGQRPEQGFTNLAIGGNVGKLIYSGDYFSEKQLNTLAGGGNWIMWQANSNAPIVTRHQLSTDVSSIERQELSITKSIDFAAKFIRNGVLPYIGRYNITPAFLGLIRTVTVGAGAYLRREGYVNDVRVDKIEQDQVSKDSILITLSISVQYPVNYIRITLQF